MEASESRGLRIGELSVLAGVSTHALRYYERVGILPRPPRTPSGYRMYPSDAVDQLAFIKKAQALGLRLADVREVLEISSGGRQPCEHVRELVHARLREVEDRLRQLRDLRRTLRETLTLLDDAPDPSAGCRCPVIESSRSHQETAQKPRREPGPS